ncbi:MAG TPA: EamA family transporter, partial [Chthoniobacteraceae bacterium]|nr:EamA family transporter [Chthoniobacteraceae bacterium]
MPSHRNPKSSKPLAGFFDPYVQITLSILLSAAAQLFLKRGADAAVGSSWLGIEGLRSGWTWFGITAMVASLFSWLRALRFIPLNIAFNLSGAIHALVPLSSWLLLGEQIGGRRWLGISLVIAGVLLVARPLVRAE